jgi:hypothetical protein
MVESALFAQFLPLAMMKTSTRRRRRGRSQLQGLVEGGEGWR